MAMKWDDAIEKVLKDYGCPMNYEVIAKEVIRKGYRSAPDTDPKYKDIDSQILTREVAEMVTNKGWEINNIDITIIAEKPKMAPYIEPMIQNLSTILNLKPERISIKAKTNEKLDAVGQEEAIVVHSIVSLLNRNKS